MRRLILSLPLLILAAAPCLLHAAPKPKPNIVIFMSDDMGWNDVGYHGSKVQTPHIDQLAKDGVELDRFYVYPICSPTRTAMMTGRSPIRFGILSPLGGSRGVPTDEYFLPQAFQKAGYQTLMVGKWHLGAQLDEHAPQNRGFDHFYGFRGGVIDYYTHESGGNLDWQRNGKTLEEEGYSTELFADEAVRLLVERDKSKPVFLYVPFNAPHGPSQAPQDLIDKYTTLGIDSRTAARAASIDSMDSAIGKVLDCLAEEGMTKDTLTIFFCDNGASGGNRARRAGTEDRGLGNAPFSGGKGTLDEGGIRVPAVMQWPGVLKPGSKSDQLMSVLDLFPTLTAATGIPHGSEKPFDGSNVWPAFAEGAGVKRVPVVIGSPGALAIIENTWKLIQTSQGVTLYNLNNDPTEETDLSAKHPEIVADLIIALEPFADIIAKNPGRGDGRRPGAGGKGKGKGKGKSKGKGQTPRP